MIVVIKIEMSMAKIMLNNVTLSLSFDFTGHRAWMVYNDEEKRANEAFHGRLLYAKKYYSIKWQGKVFAKWRISLCIIIIKLGSFTIIV